MLPLSFDDLMPLEEYAHKRLELFEAYCRYLDRYRRVRVGPEAAFVFENRQTIWFRLQEVLLIARLRDPQAVELELELFNRLLPSPGQLQAVLITTTQDHSQLGSNSGMFGGLSDKNIRFWIGRAHIFGHPQAAKPEDRCLGASHWIVFDLELSWHEHLAKLDIPAVLEIRLPEYHHQSAPLSEEIRNSLLDDLRAKHSALKLAA